jgi:arsenate reductase (thioredoxin)
MTDPHETMLTPEQAVMIRQSSVRLQREFSGTFSAETIERFITESQVDLEGRATVGTWLPVLVERFTRDRLRALARLEGLIDDHLPAVLFLCVHNAGRSQMAAGWMRHLAGDAVEVFSGGSEPASSINPVAVEAMAEMGIDIRSELPQPWTDDIVRAADVVVTMGCGDACPVFPGKRYLDWELTDPAGKPIEIVREVRDDIRARVEALLASLDVPARS